MRGWKDIPLSRRLPSFGGEAEYAAGLSISEIEMIMLQDSS